KASAGPTFTHPLFPGSPALNAGAPALLGSPDQRGVPRPGGVNIGAYQASASQFVLAGLPASSTAGVPSTFTVTAQDGYGAPAVGYVGSVQFTSSDPQANLPGGYSFNPSDGGTQVFTATLHSPGDQSIIVTDPSNGSLSASAVVTVSAAAADHFTITVPLTVVSGVPFDVVVTATDPYGNTDTNYAGTVTLSSSDTDPGVALPADYTFTPADGGVHMFTHTGLV